MADIFDNYPGERQIELQSMPHQGLVKRAEEDWAGITDPKERKRLQNRLNQRARRLRQIHKAKIEAAEPHCSQSQSRPRPPKMTAAAVAQRRRLLDQLASGAMQSYMMGRPNLNQLMSVIQLNTINAMTSNAHALRLQVDWLVCDAISSIGYIGPMEPDTLPLVPQLAGSHETPAEHASPSMD